MEELSSILFITDNYPPVYGGVANSAFRLVNSFLTNEPKLNIVVLTIGRRIDDIEIERQKRLSIIKVPFTKDEQALLHKLKRIGNQVIEEFSPQMIVGFYIYRSGFIATLLGNQHNIPVLLSIRGNDIEMSPFKRDRFGPIEFSLQHCTAINSVSSDLLKKATAINPSIQNIPNKIVFNGIVLDDSSKDNIPEISRIEDKKCINFGFLGDDRNKKGLDLVLAAFMQIGADLMQINQDVKLIIAGSISKNLIHEFNQNCKDRNFNFQTIFLGTLDHQEIDRFFKNIDIVIIPSRYDGFPNVILESVSRKIPMILSHIPNFVEFFPRHSLLFESENHLSLAAIITRIIHHQISDLNVLAEVNYTYLVNNYLDTHEYRRWMDLIKQII